MAYLPPYGMLQTGIAISPDGEAVLMSRELFRLLTGALARATGFDPQWYSTAYPDVGQAITDGQLADAFEHFNYSGYQEGRLPADLPVDEAWYLESYPDVGDALADGSVASVREHYHASGYLEGRPGTPELEAEVNYWRDVVAESAEMMTRLRDESAPAEAAAAEPTQAGAPAAEVAELAGTVHTQG